MIGILSVRHTGTRFTRNLFPEYINRHTGEKGIEDLQPYLDRLVIPLRRPERIIVSWERRDLKIEHLIRDMEQLMEYDKYEPYYLPIDAKDRQDYLDRINDRLCLNIHTDWPVVSDKHSDKATREDAENPDALVDFLDFFKRFYE